MSSCHRQGSLAWPAPMRQKPSVEQGAAGWSRCRHDRPEAGSLPLPASRGGSLTILATATTDNGNSADEAILAELSVTGSTPARSALSGGRTRRSTSPGRPYEDALLNGATREQIVTLRRHLADLIAASGNPAAMLGCSTGSVPPRPTTIPLREVAKSASASLKPYEVRIHPKYAVVFQDMSAGTSFIIRSTIAIARPSPGRTATSTPASPIWRKATPSSPAR